MENFGNNALCALMPVIEDKELLIVIRFLPLGHGGSPVEIPHS